MIFCYNVFKVGELNEKGFVSAFVAYFINGLYR